MPRDYRAEVATFLQEHPTAGANETVRELRGNRSRFLAAYAELRPKGGSEVGSALATPGNRYPSRDSGSSFGIPDVRWTETGLDCPADLDFDDWETIGQALGRILDMSRFALGDWLLFGERIYGEKYAQAVEATGRRPQTLVNYASVARRLPLDIRRAGLSWSVHAEVASLPRSQQVEWLDRAEANRWTVDELRGMLRPKPVTDDREVVPAERAIDPAEQAAVLEVYGALKREHGDWISPEQIRRIVDDAARDRVIDLDPVQITRTEATA